MSYVDPETGEILDGEPGAGEEPARQLEVQQLALLKLRDDVTHLATELAETITWLRGQLGDDSQDDEAGGQWCWRDMPPERAAQLWRELADWIGWLRGRYPVAGAIPACWWRHPELVEELTALYRAWTGAVAGGTSGTYNAIEWHDRWLPGVLARIKTWGLDRCAHQRSHHDRPAGAYDTRAVDEPDAYQAMVTDDLAKRRQASPKQPRAGASSVPGTAMKEHLAAGTARSLGDLPDSPVHYDDTFWRATADGYQRITDQALLARLRRDAERLTAANQAVAGTDESNADKR